MKNQTLTPLIPLSIPACRLRPEVSSRGSSTRGAQPEGQARFDGEGETLRSHRREGVRIAWLLIISWALSFSPASSAQTTFDPAVIGVGARSLGMGRAYVAVAEDCDAVFFNPAGLGEIDAFNFSSMSGKVLEDAAYTMLGGVYPLGNKQALGISYIGSAVSGIELRDGDGTYQKKSNFSNNIFLFSYGKKISDSFSLGLNLKYFLQDGSENDHGDGSGMNLDFGILQKGLDWFTVGVVGQNILSSGKIRYKSGREEALPQTIKIGTRIYLLGEKFTAARLSPFELNIAADAELNLQEQKAVTTHIGAEISPHQNITLRAGIDQDPIPGGVQSNLTSGISLKFAGIGFHYAYHPYTDLSANASHYFSLSFDERGWPYEGLPDSFLSRN